MRHSEIEKVWENAMIQFRWELLIPTILLRISGNIVYEEKWMTKNITCFLRMTSHITNWMITCQIREFINLYDENNMR